MSPVSEQVRHSMMSRFANFKLVRKLLGRCSQISQSTFCHRDVTHCCNDNRQRVTHVSPAHAPVWRPTEIPPWISCSCSQTVARQSPRQESDTEGQPCAHDSLAFPLPFFCSFFLFFFVFSLSLSPLLSTVSYPLPHIVIILLSLFVDVHPFFPSLWPYLSLYMCIYIHIYIYTYISLYIFSLYNVAFSLSDFLFLATWLHNQGLRLNSDLEVRMWV